MSDADLVRLRREFDAAPLSAELGLRCHDLTPGSAQVTMAVPQQLRHPGGAVPGVLLGGLGERAAALARCAGGWDPTRLSQLARMPSDS